MSVSTDAHKSSTIGAMSSAVFSVLCHSRPLLAGRPRLARARNQPGRFDERSVLDVFREQPASGLSITSRLLYYAQHGARGHAPGQARTAWTCALTVAEPRWRHASAACTERMTHYSRRSTDGHRAVASRPPDDRSVYAWERGGRGGRPTQTARPAHPHA